MTNSVDLQARITPNHAEKLRAIRATTGFNTSQVIRLLIERAELIGQLQFNVQLNAESAVVGQDKSGAFCVNTH